MVGCAELNTAAHALLLSAAQARAGIVLPVQDVADAECDILGIVNATVPADGEQPWQGTAGAVAFGDRRQARQAAVAEALERYAAARTPVTRRLRSQLAAGHGTGPMLDLDAFALFSPAQQAQPDFPWPVQSGPTDAFTPVFSLVDNAPTWVPQELVTLGLPEGDTVRAPSTSSGLAAMTDSRDGPCTALLRALQELLERDALAVSWLHGLCGREIPLPEDLRAVAVSMGAEVCALDLTQAWNPHPVVAVAGRLAVQGHPRHAFGIACRASLQEATRKAWLEWAQSLRYADFIVHRRQTRIPAEPLALRRFDEHAAYYTAHPAHWAQLPLIAARQPAPCPPDAPTAAASPGVQLQHLVHHLQAQGVSTYYRELTPPDVAAAGLRVMRVISPALSPLHADERAPFLGGRFAELGWRYPQARRGIAQGLNPWPHPLG